MHFKPQYLISLLMLDHIPINSDGLRISKIRRKYQEKYAEFLQHFQIDKTLKSLLIAVVEKAHIKSLLHKGIWHSNITAVPMIFYSYDPCTIITSNYLKENDKLLHQVRDPTLPFENLLHKVENVIDFSSTRKSLHNLKQIATME